MGVIAETAVRVRADTSGFHRDAQSGIMGSIMKVGAAAGAALGGLAIGKALFVDPIKSAGDFQQSLNVLQATSHATDGRMKEISATAMKLGADTKLPAVSASDAANAMLELAKGGFTAKESMEGARGVLLLSTAAQIDGASAATLVADSLHAFGMKAKDAGIVVNDFAGAANASTASMSEVGQSLQQSGQAFHQLGVPIGDATTAIAAMANAGIKGSDAGTSLKTMLQRLNPTTKQAKAAMHEMGVSAFDSSGHFVGMRAVIEQMSPKLRAMTQEQRQQTLSTIFGSDASRAAGIILGQTTAQWDKQHAAVTKAGQAQALADAQTKGFKGAMAALRSSIETVQLQIGLKMLPVLTVFVNFLSGKLPAAVAAVGSVLSAFGDAIRGVADWLGVFQAKAADSHGLNGLSNGLDTTRTRFDQIVGAVRSAIGVVRQFSSWVSDNIGNVRQIATAIGVGAAAFVVLTAAVRIYTAVQAALNAVMAANPITIVIVAIAALVIAMTLLYQRSATARAIMDAAWAGIRAGAAAAFGFITNTVIPGAIAAWNRFGPQVVAVLQGAVTAIRTVVQAIATVVNTVVDQIRTHWETVWKIFGPLVTAQLQIVRTTVQTVLNVIAGLVRLFAALLRGDWSGAWNALKGIVSDVLNGVKSIVTSALSGLAGTAAALATTVGNAIGNGIKSGLSALAGLAGDLVGRVTSAIGQAAGQAYTLARQIGFRIADGAVSGIGNLAGRLGSAIKDAASSAVSWAGGKLPGSGPFMFTIHTVGKPMAEGVLQGFETHIAAQRPRVAAAIERMGKAMRDASAKELPAVAQGFQKWADTAKAAFDTQVGNVTKTIDANFTKAQARLDAWKAKLTPTEFLIAQRAAAAAVAKVQADVSAAAAALNTLPAKQAAAWSALLAQQQANMAALRATLQSTTDDALLAGNTFSKGMAKAQSDPLATGLIAAQQAFDSTKALFDQGLVSQAAFIAAANVLDDAKIAAAADADATQLLQDYNTWQAALTQQAAAGGAITAQQATDLAAQQAQRDADAQETATAQEAYNQALQARADFFLNLKAERERAAKDAQYNALSVHLKAMHDRTLTHLGNVQHAWDLHYDALKNMASTSGKSIGDDLASALRNSIPTVAAAAAAVALVIQQHLKVKSPTEKGPMSDLNYWWDRLGPTLVEGFNGSSVQAALQEAVLPPGAALGSSAGRIPTTGSREQWSSQRMEFLLERIEKNTGTTAQKPNAAPEVHVSGGFGIDASVYRSKR